MTMLSGWHGGLVITTTALAVLAVGARADIGLHNPRGSNNKLNEVSNTVRNDNRLFDSQTNAASGYQVGDNCAPNCNPEGDGTYNAALPGAGAGTMYYHADSLLNIEWTVQHGCGRGNANMICDVVLQYMCEDSAPGLRDGSSRALIGGGVNENGGNTNNEERANPNPEKLGVQYGQHENYDYYMRCRARARNKGLFTADKLNSGNRQQTAIYTRQGDNAERYGFECPEERDYYPYWHPTPWRDIAVLTDDLSRCNLYQEESQNVYSKGYCELNPPYACSAHQACVDQRYNENNAPYNTAPVPNNRRDCEAWGATHPGQSGTWRAAAPWLTRAPECLPAPWSRQNHLGNGKDNRMASYTWRLPDDDAVVGKRCVLRVRYNTSSFDLPWDADAGSNGKITQDPVADFIGGGVEQTGPLRLNIDTAQYFRTFEDRSHVFEIREKAPGVPWYAEVVNFNVRGRRGNIVQVYPSVEYDFTWPRRDNDPATGTSFHRGDVLHVQWTGSDANPPGNAGNGRRQTDRSNLVQMASPGLSYPKTLLTTEGDAKLAVLDMDKSIFADAATVSKLAYLGQTGASGCDHNEDDNAQSVKNCAQMNAAPAYFDGGLVPLGKVGTFHIYSTRNTDFTNRSQKATLTVTMNPYLIAAAVLGGLATVLAIWGSYRTRKWWTAKLLERKLIGLAAHDTINALHVKKRARSFLGLETGDDNDEGADGAVPKSWCARWLAQLDEWWAFEGQRVKVLLAYVCINGALFAYGYVAHLGRSEAPYYPLAKAGGAMLNFNCALIVLPVCRNFVSWLRSTPVAEVIPFDDAVAFHRIVGMGIAGALVLHVACHYLDFEYFRKAHGTPVSSQAVGSWAGITGHIALTCMLLMAVTSLACVRRGRVPLPCGCRTRKTGKKSLGGYSLFQKVHRLWAVVMLVLLMHGKRFWIYAFWPLCLLATEKLIHRRRAKEPVRVLEVRQFDKHVMRVKFRLANGRRFRFTAGQYLLLHCPELSQGWHPFTITSAPEDGFISCHIRCRPNMDFTSRLRLRLNPNSATIVNFDPSVKPGLDAGPDNDAHVDRAGDGRGERRDPTESGRWVPAVLRRWSRRHAAHDALPTSSSSSQGVATVRNPMRDKGTAGVLRPPVIKIDGPFGSASEEVFRYQRLILVGAGIGVTPFASIMRSLALRARNWEMLRSRGGAFSGSMGGGDDDGKAAAAEATGPPQAWQGAVTNTPRRRTYFFNDKGKTAWSAPGSNKRAASTSAPDCFADGSNTTVHFFWICRSREEFDSFKTLLKDDIRSQSELAKYFHFNLYVSGELNLTDPDFLNETRAYSSWTQLYTGRPRWDRIFREVKAESAAAASPSSSNEVGVFLCGPGAIGKTLKEASRKHSDSTAQFSFHMEHF